MNTRAEPAAWMRMVDAPRLPAVVGTLLALLAVVEAGTRAVVDDTTVRGGLVLCLLALATTLPLALLPPALAAISVSAASALSLGLFDTLTVAGAATQLVILHRLGRESSQPATVLLALPFLALAVTDTAGSDGRVMAIVLASLAPAAALAGLAAAARNEATEHSAARRAIAGSLVEHTARGERARISRELHDVVAHHISMIAVEAETARLTTPGLPAAGAQRLLKIGDTARAALTEMRRLLGVLREDADIGPADLEPQPGLRQLNELLDSSRDAAGSQARLILRGRPMPLDPGVELAAYRIVQEALTNARRHAAGAAVDVELHYTDDRLRLRIRDNGPGPSATPTAPGHGLLGMKERAAAVGGELLTGGAPGGGFLVAASLPGKGDQDR